MLTTQQPFQGATPETAEVILFKPSGKYYTTDDWRIPTQVPNPKTGAPQKAIGPYCMEYSPDFRRIDGGAVLVPDQEPWGYPHLFPSIKETNNVR